jgi:bifunctional DNase/RNase
MDVLGVRVEMPTNQPIVLLRERGGRRYLPIWIGAAEASAIAYAQQGVVPPRPLTHDLMATLIEQLGHRLSKVRITALTDGAFHAVLVLDSDGDQVATEVDSRSSDAIALALRTGATIEADEDLLDEVGVHMDEEGAESDGDDEAPSEDVLAEFKEFLDNVSPEDFETDEPPAQS